MSLGLRLNLWLLSFARNWLRIVMVILVIYVSLPWIAPTLMKVGLDGPANTIYTLYRGFCHQMGFRTIFLYGDQPVYPLASTGSAWQPFESYINRSPVFDALRMGQTPRPPFSVENITAFYGLRIGDQVLPDPENVREVQNFAQFQLAAAAFPGNEEMGYKMSLCARDIAIYTMVFVFTLIYSRPAIRRRLRPLPLWLYLLAGVTPIAIDGFSQLLGYPPFSLWPSRETLPVFRVLTGAYFGFMTAWFGLPHIEAAMRDTIRDIESKLAKLGITPNALRP